MYRFIALAFAFCCFALLQAQDYMKYARMYEGCEDKEPSVIYGASYNPYPPGLTDAEFPGGDVEFIVYIKNNTELQEVYSGEYDEQGRPLLVTGEVWVPIFKAAELDGYRVKSAYIAKIPFTKPLWEEPEPDPLYYYDDYYY